MTTAISTPDPAITQRAPHDWEYRRGEWLPVEGGVLTEDYDSGDMNEDYLHVGFGEARKIGQLAGTGISLKLRVAFDDAKWRYVVEVEGPEIEDAPFGEDLGSIAVPDLPSLLMLLRDLSIRRPPQQRAAEQERRRKADREEDY